jgi:hypothetical protein
MDDQLTPFRGKMFATYAIDLSNGRSLKRYRAETKRSLAVEIASSSTR